MLFSGAFSEERLGRMGKIYVGRPFKGKTRRQLLASVRPNFWQYLRPDNGDMPEAFALPII
jgi:hypothetical protein